MLLPLFTEEWLEFGLGRALRTQLRHIVSLRPLYTFFLERTKGYAYDNALMTGQARYIATGRSMLSDGTNFTAIFKMYSRSHFDFAAEVGVLLLAWSLFTHEQDPANSAAFWLYLVPLLLFVVGTAISPWLFNPLLLSASTLIHHFKNFLLWVDAAPLVDSWHRWQTEHRKPVRAMPVPVRVGIFCTRLLPQRVVLLFVAMFALELPELAPTHTPRAREVLSLYLGLGALFSTLIQYAVADSGSSRRLFAFTSVWLRHLFLFVLRGGVTAAYLAISLAYFADGLLLSRRNGLAILLTGGAWVSLVTQTFALFQGPGEGKPSTRLELRRFSDFLQREGDLCTCTVIVIILVLLALLPLASFHSALMVRPSSPQPLAPGPGPSP